MLTGVFIERFAQRHPRVKLRIYEGLSNVLHDHMAAGLLDMCVVPFRPMPFSGYRRSALARESLALVGQASAGLDSNRMVPISRLQGEDLIMPEKPNALRLQIEHSIERLGIECRVTIETDALGVCLDLARRGVGMTIVPYSALVGDAALAGLSWSPIKGQQITWALLENESREHAQVCREVRKGLIAALARTLADGHWKHAEGMVS